MKMKGQVGIMKKMMVMVLFLLMAASLAACGGNAGNNTTSTRENVQREQDAASTNAESSEKTYTVTIKDQDGGGVSGCVVNFCNAASCSPVMIDTNGVYTYSGVAYAYHVQVVKVPEGYKYDTSKEYIANADGGNIDVTVTK